VGTRSSTLAIRLVILISIWLLGTATFSLAQDGSTTSPVQDDVATSGDPATTTDTSGQTTDTSGQTTDTSGEGADTSGDTAEATGPLVVPDVLQLPYVFAKGVLEDAGFAWKVKGKVEGYAVNYVVEQSVAPLTRVVDTGAPTIILKLAKNPAYDERGIPDNSSPFKGTAVELEDGGEPEAATAEVPAADTGEADAASSGSASKDSASEASSASSPTIE
jgi:hypothetical protein